jgi:hypothetical protein
MSAVASKQQPIVAAARSILASVLVLTLTLAACSQSKQAPAAPPQRTFASPDEAGKALIEAVQSGDQNSMLAIFGSGSKSTIYSGDPTEDKLSFANFAKAYQVMNRWRKVDDKTEVLFVGADNRAFPVPLTKNDAGQWYFNTPAGTDELLAQRIEVEADEAEASEPIAPHVGASKLFAAPGFECAGISLHRLLFRVCAALVAAPQRGSNHKGCPHDAWRRATSHRVYGRPEGNHKGCPYDCSPALRRPSIRRSTTSAGRNLA